MNADDALRALINADHLSRPALGGRIFPSVAPQGCERPYCLIHDQGGDDEGTLDGPSGKPKGRWTVEIWGDDPDSIRTPAYWVRHKLNGFDGYAGDICFEVMRATLPEADAQQDDSAPDGETFYCRRFEVTAFYSEVLDPNQYSPTL